MSVDVQFIRDHYQQCWDQASELLREYSATLKDLKKLRKTATTERDKTSLALAQDYLSELSPEALERAQQLTGFTGFKRKNPIKAMHKEEKQLKRTIKELKQEPQYIKRDKLVGPKGSISAQHNEAISMLEPWLEDCAKFEDLPGFKELIEVGYDTPAFKLSWLTTRYWQLWRQGDEVCEALEMDDFGDDVLPAYLRVSKFRRRWQGEAKRFQEQIDAVHGLVQEHDQAVARLGSLEKLYWRQCCQALAEFLHMADVPLLEQWRAREAPNSQGLQMGLRRLAGLNAKLSYLQQYQEDGIAPLVKELKKRKSKFDRKFTKYNRPKYVYYRFEDTDLEAKFLAKVGKLKKKQTRAQKLIDRIGRYDDYDRFDLSNDPNLWWTEMTNSKPGRFTPRIRTWYEKHADAKPTHDPSVQEEEGNSAAAQAMAAEDRAEDLGYTS